MDVAINVSLRTNVCLLHIIYDVWLCQLTDLSLTQPQSVVY